MAKAPKSAETIMAAAEAETHPSALSEAAKTEPRDDAKEPSASKPGLEARVAKLEQTIAYLRELFGWPNNGD